MKLRILVMLIALSTKLNAQDCLSLIHKHAISTVKSKQDYKLSLKAANKSTLSYFGAEHSDVFTHPQFRGIKEMWNSAAPTIALYEGPDRGIAATDTGTIHQFGESGYVRYLASIAKIKTSSLEPPIDKLYAYLLANMPQDKVDLYMFTKEAMRLRTRKNLSEAQLNEQIGKMMKMVPQMVKQPVSFQSVEDLNNAMEKYFPGSKWWLADERWFSPEVDEKETNSFTNTLARLSSEYRDRYMVELISGYVKAGGAVFAVVGRDHIPMQKDALKCAIDLIR